MTRQGQVTRMQRDWLCARLWAARAQRYPDDDAYVAIAHACSALHALYARRAAFRLLWS